MKYVAYGKIGGSPKPDDWLDPAYRWLGQHCGYYPQVWLSKGSSNITGFRPWKAGSKRAMRNKRHQRDVLFGFDTVAGFPVDYDMWHYVISLAEEYEKTFGRITDRASARGFERWLWLEHKKMDVEYFAECPEDRESMITLNFASIDDWLARSLFVERDQVVVPSLNLKAAKKVLCHDEKQARFLRKMGFIDDRIEIRNFFG